SGRTPYLYFTRSHMTVNGQSCYRTFDRDLDRVQIQFTRPGSAAATASFAMSSNPVPAGSSVTFDASSSKTIDDSTPSYSWDLDGNGSFETATGSNPKVTRSYSKPGRLTIRLRVRDQLADAMETSRRLSVKACARKAVETCGGNAPTG